MANETYLNNVDTEKVEKLLSETGENAKYFEDISSKTALKYTEHLDRLMQNLYKRVIASNIVDDVELETDLLELTSLIYFMGDMLESLGVYADMSSAAAKENMNDATSDTSTHPDNDNKENLNKLIFLNLRQ